MTTTTQSPESTDLAFDIAAMDWEPLITKEQLYENENPEADSIRAENRRIALAVLTQTSDELKHIAAEAPDIAGEALRCARDMHLHYQAVADMMKNAMTRLIAALVAAEQPSEKVGGDGMTVEEVEELFTEAVDLVFGDKEATD